MKKGLIALCVAFSSVCSMGAWAGDVGVVDMQKVFQSSSKAKTISEDLKKQFSSRRANIVKMSEALQADVQKYQKNESVLSKAQLTQLQESISKQGNTLRQAQSKFQSDLMAEQNKKMSGFINQVKASVSKVAKKKNLEVVFPSNTVLYSKDELDITSEVLADLK